MVRHLQSIIQPIHQYNNTQIIILFSTHNYLEAYSYDLYEGGFQKNNYIWATKTLDWISNFRLAHAWSYTCFKCIFILFFSTGLFWTSDTWAYVLCWLFRLLCLQRVWWILLFKNVEIALIKICWLTCTFHLYYYAFTSLWL